MNDGDWTYRRFQQLERRDDLPRDRTAVDAVAFDIRRERRKLVADLKSGAIDDGEYGRRYQELRSDTAWLMKWRR